MNNNKLIPVQPASSEYITLLTKTAWFFCGAILWPHKNFTCTEAKKRKRKIKQLLITGHKPYEAYIEFCERVLIQQQLNLSAKSKPLHLSASSWLNPYAAAGIKQTADAYNRIVQIRKKYPLAGAWRKSLAEAILDMAAEDIHLLPSWQLWFINREQKNTLSIFYDCLHRLGYKNQQHEQ